MADTREAAQRDYDEAMLELQQLIDEREILEARINRLEEFKRKGGNIPLLLQGLADDIKELENVKGWIEYYRQITLEALERLAAFVTMAETNELEQEVLPNLIAEGALDVHNAFRKIETAKLIKFFKQSLPNYLTESINNNAYELNDAQFKGYLKETLDGFIDTIENSNIKRKSEEYLEKIFETLGTILYDKEDKKLITYCLEYVKQQPKAFQKIYVELYTKDNACAYSGPDPNNISMSCAKGMMERFVLKLVDAATAVESINKSAYNSNNYEELINIIENKPLTIKKLIDKYAQECSKNETINSDTKLIECVKNKIRDKHTELFTNNVSRQINEYIPMLMLYGGRIRKSIKTRKARKNKRKTLAKHKKSLRRKHKLRRHTRR
jgi:hypothetical protein